MLSAAIIGGLFGIVIQRGGFCGAALLSSVVLYKEIKGVIAILLTVFVSMVGFAALERWDLIIINPKPLRLIPALVGGALFGCGMVLAGGCVTGTLYKAAEGRLTSMLALLGIGMGSNTTRHGLLAPAKKALMRASRGVRLPAGAHDVAGLPFNALAAPVGAVATVVILLATFRRWRSGGSKLSLNKAWRGSWPVVAVGVMVGVLGWAAYLSSSAAGRNLPLGGLGGVSILFSKLVGGPRTGGEWIMLEVLGILVGSALSAWIQGSLSLRSADAQTLLTALAGGFLVGAGATLGSGCFIGNIISGLAMMSIHSALFAVVMVASNWITTILYLRGLR